MINESCFQARVLLAVLLSGLAGTGANAAVTVLGVQYQPDQLFPEYNCIWHDKNYPTSCPSNVAGANVHVYLKNTGASSVTVSDATVKGYSLETVLHGGDIGGARSIYYYWDNPPDDIVYAVGEPVWYKAVPSTIPPVEFAQVVVRLRYIPTDPALAIGVVTSGGTVTTNITVDANAPQLGRVGLAAGLTNVTLHWRRSGGAAPTSIWMDGTDVTANTTTVGDPTVDFGASVISLAAPLSPMSYHVFQGVYADGKTATAGLRAWANKFIYATYGTLLYSGHDWIVEATRHGVNNCQLGGIGSYLGTSAGQADALANEFGYTCQDIAHLNDLDPDMWFLNDEPDAQEDNQSVANCGTGRKIPCGEGHTTGILVMSEIAHGESLQAVRPLTPTSVNMDGTLKPNNYLSWGQGFDVLQVDPYYQKRLSDSYWHYPDRIPLYKKATYIYAVSRGVAAAAEPNPSNVLLYSCEWHDPNGKIWPFPTPESKRIEVYYALAGGATGMGYWWLNPGNPSNGLGDQSNPAARTLWKEIGLLGNEIKTARSLLVRSTPVNLPLTPGANVWVRALASGTDTIILLVVNDNYFNDLAGCHYTNVNNATVTATLPSWMQSPTAFEISAGGLSDVSTTPNGNQLQVNLGTLKLTRMIVLTKDAELRATIQQWYDQMVRPGICAIAPELCANQPPNIAQSPANQSVIPGGTANFTVLASGSDPLSYQWQKNSTNLSDGGHYSGAATATLTIFSADNNDVASYRCVVTNTYGSTNSGSATLTVTNSSNPPIIIESPTNQTVIPGGTCSFMVAAVGASPLSYQWQKNSANLSDGGHYSGCTNTTLTISSADANDAANYRCVVTNTYGSTNSIAATLTVTNVISPPIITQQPSSQSVTAGGTASFTVSASGSDPLSYQWQKANGNLNNGGHYSGCTTNTLMITGADANDAASYRCVVTNGYGSTNSSPATLTLSAGCNPVSLVNAVFEGGNTGGVATGWTGYQRPPNPTTVWTIQTNAPPTGGGLQYQQIANTSSTGGGGVRQDVTGCTIGATYTISGWMRGNSALATCTVKCSPTASTAWATAMDLSPPQTASTNNWVPFSGTVLATGTNMTIWLDGQTGGTGQNKAECFDSVTVTCVGPPAPLQFESVAMQPQNQLRLVLSGEPGGSVTIQRSSNLLNWVTLTNLINSNGTAQFTDVSATNTPQRFYRATSP